MIHVPLATMTLTINWWQYEPLVHHDFSIPRHSVPHSMHFLIWILAASSDKMRTFTLTCIDTWRFTASSLLGSTGNPYLEVGCVPIKVLLVYHIPIVSTGLINVGTPSMITVLACRRNDQVRSKRTDVMWRIGCLAAWFCSALQVLQTWVCLPVHLVLLDFVRRYECPYGGPIE